MPWFQRRRAAAELEQHRLWRQARMRTNIQQLMSKMSELETVDLFDAIERHFNQELQVLPSLLDNRLVSGSICFCFVCFCFFLYLSAQIMFRSLRSKGNYKMVLQLEMQN